MSDDLKTDNAHKWVNRSYAPIPSLCSFYSFAKLFLPLLKDFCIIAPDVIGMPGKSAPYRNISSRKDQYGLWINEVLNHYKVEKISFVVSSYSSAMFLSFANL